MDIIIETPAGSNVKYKYDEASGKLKVLKLLPEGMVFPFAFGFMPGTKSQDGDPLDVLLIAEFPIAPGSLVEVRLIGCIPVEQGNGKKMIQNDRYLAIPLASRQYEDIQEASQLPSVLLSNIKGFFKNYIEAEGKEIIIKDIVDSVVALAMKVSSQDR